MAAFLHHETVRFGQVDAAGIVFYPRIHEWLSNTVEAWFADGLGTSWQQLHLEQRVGTPIVEGRIQFRRANRLGDRLAIALAVDKLGQHNFDLNFTLSCDGEERVQAWQRHLWVGLDPLGARPLPEWMRARMESFRA